jgi:hypothetical protein
VLSVAAVSFGLTAVAGSAFPPAPLRAQTHDFTTTVLVVKGLPSTGPKRAGTYDFKTDGLVVRGLAGGPARPKTLDIKTDALIVRGISK